MQNDDKQKTLFGYPVVEVEMENIPENPQIVLGDMSAYVTWRIRKRHLKQCSPEFHSALMDDGETICMVCKSPLSR